MVSQHIIAIRISISTFEMNLRWLHSVTLYGHGTRTQMQLAKMLALVNDLMWLENLLEIVCAVAFAAGA